MDGTASLIYLLAAMESGEKPGREQKVNKRSAVKNNERK
jgi:hypothetical protein